MMTAVRLADILQKAGFSSREIKALTTPTVNQFDGTEQSVDTLWKTGLIQKAIKSRVKYIHQCRDLGWTGEEIKRSIRAIDRSIEAQGGYFLWLRIEYAIRASTPSYNYRVMSKRRAKDLINKTANKLGVRYGKRSYVYHQPVTGKLTVRPVQQRLQGT